MCRREIRSSSSESVSRSFTVQAIGNSEQGGLAAKFMGCLGDELTLERLVDYDFVAVIPLPLYAWLRAAFRLAAQRHVIALAHDDVTGGQGVVYVGGH